MTVINACQRPVVAVKIPEVDDMLQRAQDKVDAIKRVQSITAGAHLIDEVVFAQNVPTYNPEWQHSNEGKATSYLAMLVCRYMNELQRKDKKVVLSAKALEAIYDTVTKEAADERHGNTFNKWSWEKLSEFREESQNLLRMCTKKGIGIKQLKRSSRKTNTDDEF